MWRDHSGKRFQEFEGGIETMTRTRWSLLGVLVVAVVFACGYATLATADRVSHPMSAVTNVSSGVEGLSSRAPRTRRGKATPRLAAVMAVSRT